MAITLFKVIQRQSINQSAMEIRVRILVPIESLYTTSY